MFIEFLTVFLLTLSLGLFIAGIFTVYFGSGKSRGIGAGLLVGGIVIGLLVIMLAYMNVTPYHDMAELGAVDDTPGESSLWWVWHTVIDALVYLIAAIIGALAAVGMFLLAIMKS